jgi:hypothetical protein
MNKLSVNDLNVKNQRVLVRVDYNVPMEEKDGKMIINDTTRIKETLPTLLLLVAKRGQNHPRRPPRPPQRQTRAFHVPSPGGGKSFPK